MKARHDRQTEPDETGWELPEIGWDIVTETDWELVTETDWETPPDLWTGPPEVWA